MAWLHKVTVLPASTTGSGLTLAVAVAVEVQPEAFVTVTVYVVVVLGLTCVVDVVSPVLHRYDPPPVAANVAGWPEQLVDPVVVTCGNEFTVTKI